MKPQTEAILAYLLRRGGFVPPTEIIKDCYTTTPSKRLDELHDAGLIVKEQHKGRQMKYRAKTMPEILMGRTA